MYLYLNNFFRILARKLYSHDDEMIENLDEFVQRYVNPIVSLTDNYESKIIFASSFTLLNYITEQLFNIVATELHLVWSLALLIIIDLLSGVYASMMCKRKITSLKLRSTFVKIIEYIMVLLPLTILSNMDSSLNWIQMWAYVFICATEVKSIGENLFHTETNAKKVLTEFWKILKQKNNVNVE